MVTRINPAGLYDALGYGFSHATRQEAGATLHLAGQVAWDKDCNVVGAGDLAAQTRQALANLKAVLAEAGCGPADIVRLRTYVVDHSPDKLGPVLGAVGEFYGDAVPAPNTFIGVAALALPDFLVEIEATAAIPNT
ncbi:RidA family protein [Sphingomonas oryzagri]|jgi:enamine deaminase RidA (YjgF/YER057c/UK114 family)|uniref:RidA family protein n=1 Tax=Sphingomonas oryzagri TaxID=3042314 RepID=A0ABT6N4G4_9SPHN|nr:RidA family protein [Sphingomonas oryzagri]MDH7640033.1 RidA family protein [Sphingomonas oryzagri]